MGGGASKSKVAPETAVATEEPKADKADKKPDKKAEKPDKKGKKR